MNLQEPIWRCLLITGILFVSEPSFAQVVWLDMDKVDSNQMNSRGSNAGAEINGNANFVANRFGVPCRAFKFDGSSYLSIPHQNNLNLSAAFTVMAWLKFDEFDTDNWITLICKGDQQIENHQSPAFRLQLTKSTASVNTNSTGEIDKNHESYLKNQSYPTDTWFHFAAVFQRSGLIWETSKLSIYVDGILYRTFGFNSELSSNGQPLNIGRDVPGGLEFFTGTLDDFRLYDSAFSENEVLAVFRNQSDKALPDGCPVNVQKTNPLSGVVNSKNTVNNNPIQQTIPVPKNARAVKILPKTDWSGFSEIDQNVTKDELPETDWNSFDDVSISTQNTSKKDSISDRDLPDTDWNVFDSKNNHLDTIITERQNAKTDSIQLEDDERELEERMDAETKLIEEERLKEVAIQEAERRAVLRAKVEEEKRVANLAKKENERRKAKAKAKMENDKRLAELARLEDEARKANEIAKLHSENRKKGNETYQDLIERIESASIDPKYRQEILFDELARAYENDMTEEVDSVGKAVVYRHIFRIGDEVVVYEEKVYDFGTYYFRITKIKEFDITKAIYRQELKHARNQVLENQIK